jgi:hypothetical protein
MQGGVPGGASCAARHAAAPHSVDPDLVTFSEVVRPLQRAIATTFNYAVPQDSRVGYENFAAFGP